MERVRVIPVMHDVSSAQRLVDAARTVYGLGFRVFVATRVYGAAAQNGVPEAMRLALRLGRSFVVLPELRDAVELFAPETVLVVSRDYGEPVSLDGLGRLARGRTMVVVGGGEPGISKGDAAAGKPVYFEGVEARLSPVAELALVLYALRGVAGGEESGEAGDA